MGPDSGSNSPQQASDTLHVQGVIFATSSLRKGREHSTAMRLRVVDLTRTDDGEGGAVLGVTFRQGLTCKSTSGYSE